MRADVLVVGGGHAGIEAGWAAQRLGAKVVLITANVDHIGQMSCNPSIGGPGKSQLVHELDMLGGLMARLIDQTVLHQRLLNTSRGPAVQALRAQADMKNYAWLAKHTLEKAPHLTLLQDEVVDIAPAPGGWSVKTQTHSRVLAKKVVITTGTFLRGQIFIGKNFCKAAGRYGDEAATELGFSLDRLGVTTRRLKTGTVPRVNGKSIDFSKTSPLPSTDDHLTFSFFTHPTPSANRIACYLTHTTPQTREVVMNDLQESALFGGKITGRGPRYCPSIEDKFVRFADKTVHPVFLEPEGYETQLFYLQGISTSLPPKAQEKLVKSIEGLEQAEIVKWGYAVEYDAIDARTLSLALEHQDHPGLYFAGQVNGTTGYEEAAAQGLLAVANAALSATGKTPLVLSREESYIGVMVDDLTNLEVHEPYRMFSSRCENRLTLRQDNCADRLGEKAHLCGLLNNEEFDQVAIFLEEKAAHRQQAPRTVTPNRLAQPTPKAMFSALCENFYDGYVAIAKRKQARAGRAATLACITDDLLQKLQGRLSNEASEFLIRHKGLQLQDVFFSSALKASDREILALMKS